MDRGAFFKSIIGTLNHLLWGDTIWLHRLAGTATPTKSSIPESVFETPDWATYCARRQAKDADILDWGERVTVADLSGDLTYFSQAVGRELTKPMGLFVVHFFNHQTHHRGQVNAMLTAAGMTLPDTDVAFGPN